MERAQKRKDLSDDVPVAVYCILTFHKWVEFAIYEDAENSLESTAPDERALQNYWETSQRHCFATRKRTIEYYKRQKGYGCVNI